MTGFYLLFALLTPWALGFSIVRGLMKKRYGQTAFALGCGYLLGLFFISIILAWADENGVVVNLNILLISLGLATLAILFFLPPRRCSMEEHRLEKAPSNLAYSIVFLLVVLLVYRWGLTAWDMFNKPFQLTEHGLGLLVKAKVFYYQQVFPTTEALGPALGSVKEVASQPVGWFMQWDLVSLIQSYMALSMETWDERILRLPWLILNLALALSVFGGLRYLGAGLLPSVLAVYLISSLPILETQLILGGYPDSWGGVALLLAVFSWVFILVYQEWRFLIVFLLCFASLAFSNTAALIFTIVFPVLLLWRLLNLGLYSLLLFAILIMFFLVFKEVFTTELARILSEDLSEVISFFSKPEGEGKVVQKWILEDNWHFLFLASVLAFLALLTKGKYYRYPCGFLLLAVAALTVFVITLGAVFLTNTSLMLGSHEGFLTVSLYFVLLYALLAVNAYEIVAAE